MADVSYNVLDMDNLANNEETEVFKGSVNEIIHAVGILEDYGLVKLYSYNDKIPGTNAQTSMTLVRCNFAIAETPLKENGYNLTKDQVNDLFKAYLNWKAANE